MIGIIGYGMVGKAVAHGFSKTDILISDPAINDLSISYMCSKQPEAIFVCVPTPTDDTNYSVLKEVLLSIELTDYKGLIVVKSTVLPEHLSGFNVIYNPEFLSRATSFEDFVNPPMVIIGSDNDDGFALADLYRKYSTVNMDCVQFMDIKTACLTKYTMNCFYALKLTYMNAIYDIAEDIGADYDRLVNALKLQPWMGTHHFQVPGPDGQRGFGGPCLPKDTEAMVRAFDVEILKSALSLNDKYRGNN
jgi:UDPglucose 6-dehydrogenase